ncbi:MAG TPA: hypothetical protein VGB45_04430 [Abditibacterium sp.]|jgi:hypothetical protein
MQKYEYLIVSLIAQLIGSVVTIYFPNGTEERADDNIAVVLNQLATQSWEVVSSAGGHGVFHWTMQREVKGSEIKP